MTGILLIGVVVAWLFAVFTFTRWTIRRFDSGVSKTVAAMVVFPALLVAPVADELIGMQQFESLCKKYAVQQIDEQHAMNRRVVYVRRTQDRFADGTALRIRIDPIVFRDAETDRILVSYHTLHATGGWLIRMLGISETNAPILFGSGCAPKDQDAFKKKFNITVIN